MITNFILYGTAEQKKKEKKDGAFWLALALKRRLFSESLLCSFLLFVKDVTCPMCLYVCVQRDWI